METNNNVLEYIISEVNQSVARLGINTMLSISEDKDCTGYEYLKVTSTPFQTMPVLFKEIKLEGKISLFKKDNDVKIIVGLEYRYQTFDSGSNGHTLGTFIFVTSKEFWENYDGKHPSSLRYEIDKVKGLAI